MAVELPLRVEDREGLVWLLGQACELERGLRCEDLVALFSSRAALMRG